MRLFLLVLLAISASGQVINVSGGDSTLLNAAGGKIVLYQGEHGEASVSVGQFAGKLAVGFSEKFSVDGWSLALGDRTLASVLPTDFSSVGYTFAGRGVSAERGTDDNKLLLFAGATAKSLDTGFVSAATSADPTGLLIWRKKLNKHFSFQSQEIFAEKQTAIQSLVFGVRDLRAALSAGVGNNGPMVGALVSVTNRFIQARASYTVSGPDFRRITLPNVLVAENRGFNGQVTLQPVRFLNLTAAHQNYTANNQQAAVNSFGAAVLAGPFDVNASRFLAAKTTGSSAGAGFRFGDLATLHAAAFWSPAGRTLTGNLSERLTRRIHITQFVTRSAGHTTLSFGGDFSTNLVSGGVGYQMLFFPFLPNAPFQRTFDVHLSFQFPHSASATVATTLLPTGKLRYTVFGNQYLYGPLATTSTPQQHFTTGGKYLVSGRVVDKTGAPVDGAAVQIGQQIVFSDQQGAFFVRFNSGKVQPVRVLPDQFAAPGAWAVVSAPDSATPGPEPAPLEIVVVRP